MTGHIMGGEKNPHSSLFKKEKKLKSLRRLQSFHDDIPVCEVQGPASVRRDRSCPRPDRAGSSRFQPPHLTSGRLVLAAGASGKPYGKRAKKPHPAGGKQQASSCEPRWAVSVKKTQKVPFLSFPTAHGALSALPTMPSMWRSRTLAARGDVPRGSAPLLS